MSGQSPSPPPKWIRYLNNKTEAGYCYNCQQRGIGQIRLDTVGATDGSLNEAIEQFKTIAGQSPGNCLSKRFIVITDLSRGTANNMTYILERTSSGNYVPKDQFQTGQAEFGVGNICESDRTPTGLIGLGTLNRYGGRIENGQRYNWPLLKYRGREVNYINTRGLEPRNRNLERRGAVFHPITYNTGNTTKGCSGFPIEKFKAWAHHLQNSCAYHYDGGDVKPPSQQDKASLAGCK